MKPTESVCVKGVTFDLSTDPQGRVRVSRDGHAFRGHVEQDSRGHFKVSFIAAKQFKDKHTAVEHLAYWYLFEGYKTPLSIKCIRWPDGTLSNVSKRPSDGALQLTIWQIEAKIEEARASIDKLPDEQGAVLGKNRVYRAEIGLKVHRAIELMLKVLLGCGAENDEWRFYGENKTHSLSLLFDKLQAQIPGAATRLDEVFQRTVMVHGDPQFGEFLNPTSSKIGNGVILTIGSSDDITMPSARQLRDHLVLIELHSTHSQAYLGDAVQRISEAYLKYIVDAVPYLEFVETAMREVAMPSVKHLLYASEQI